MQKKFTITIFLFYYILYIYIILNNKDLNIIYLLKSTFYFIVNFNIKYNLFWIIIFLSCIPRKIIIFYHMSNLMSHSKNKNKNKIN